MRVLNLIAAVLLGLLGLSSAVEGQAGSNPDPLIQSLRSAYPGVAVYDSNGRVRAVFSANAEAQTCDGPGQGSVVMTYDAARQVTVLVGAYRWSNRTYLTQTWEWDGSQWKKRAEVGPMFSSASFVFDARREVLVMPLSYGRISEWDGAIWIDRGMVGPEWSFSPAAAYDSKRGVTVIHVEDSLHFPLGPATFEWDGDQMEFLGYIGPYRWAGHAMAYDEARGVSVLFGGAEPGSATRYRNDTWTWDGTVWTQVATTGPTPRGGSMAYDSARKVIVLFGGGDETQLFGDTWEWDGQSWDLRATTGPAPRGGHGLAYDSARGVTVLYGGHTDEGESGETWEWNGKSWTLRHVTCYADCDTSTGCANLDLLDFICFGNSFVTGDPYACDCDTSTGPGVCDLLDFICFQTAFVVGCP